MTVSPNQIIIIIIILRQGSTVTNNQLTIDGVPEGVTSDQVTSDLKATIEKDLKAPDGLLEAAVGSNNVTLYETTGVGSYIHLFIYLFILMKSML